MFGDFGAEQIFIVSDKMLLITNRFGIERSLSVGGSYTTVCQPSRGENPRALASVIERTG